VKKLAVVGILAGVLVLLVASIPVAQAAGPQGQLAYNLNILGKPKTYTGNGAWNGERHTIFIPLRTSWYTDPCSTTGGQNNPGATSIPVQVPTNGIKLSIQGGTDFSVIDGDATADNQAVLQVPAGTGLYNVYAVAKGKPGGCLDLESYVYSGTTLVFLGSIDADRAAGKPYAVNMTNLIYPKNVDLFADPYNGLFWQLYNNGLRLLNIRFYKA
jgi:hypothetical protein